MPFNMSPLELFSFIGIPAASDFISSLVASRGAGDAAESQIAATERAAQITAQTSREALDFQRQAYNDQVRRLEPFRRGNEQAYGRLMDLSGFPAPAPSAPTQPIAAPARQIPAQAGPSGQQPATSGGRSWVPQVLGTAANVGTGLALSKLGKGAAGGAAAGGGGAGSTRSLATNPLTIGAAAVGLGAMGWLKSQAHWEANDIVDTFQNPFHREFLAPLMEDVRAGRVDPNQALQSLESNWNQYQGVTKEWAGSSSDRNTVFNQSLETLSPVIADLRAEIEAKAGQAQPSIQTGQTINMTQGADGTFQAAQSSRDRLLGAAAKYRRSA